MVVLSALVGPGEGRVGRIVALARQHLQMDVAYVAEFTDHGQTFRSVDGDSAPFGIAVGGLHESNRSFANEIWIEGLPRVVANNFAPDRGHPAAEPTRMATSTAHIPRSHDPTASDTAGADPTVASVGSYVGVPLMLSDGKVWGSFCCISRSPQMLEQRDMQFMVMLSNLLVGELDVQYAMDQSRARISGLLRDGSITMAFQPIVDVHDGTCLGVEALSRFPAGFGTPDSVFDIARSVGLGTELEVLAARKALSAIPLIPDEQFLAVNLTPEVAFHLTRDPALLDGLPIDRLVLEVTENMALHGYSAFRERLAPLREQGLRLSIDDAGAGYASLYHIIELSPDIIKIDRSIVSGVDKDRSRRSAIRAFVAIAGDLGATVVAEGVETEAELDTVRNLHVDGVQGFLLGRPNTDVGSLANVRYPLSRNPTSASRVRHPPDPSPINLKAS